MGEGRYILGVSGSMNQPEDVDEPTTFNEIRERWKERKMREQIKKISRGKPYNRINVSVSGLVGYATSS